MKNNHLSDSAAQNQTKKFLQQQMAHLAQTTFDATAEIT